MPGEENKTEVFTLDEVGGVAAEARSSVTKWCKYEQYVQPVLAELLGTSLFVFVGCGSVIGNLEHSSVAQPAVAHGLGLAILIMVFGQISGGHLNPAVSLSVYLCGGMELLMLVPYVIAQMAGGMIGAFLTKGVFPSDKYTASLGGAFDVGSSYLGIVIVAEMVLTFILTMVVCMLAVNKKTRTESAPFCIGLIATANIFAGVTLSGACMNPARAFGPAAAANHWAHHWVYWVGPACGALLTASFVRLFLGDRKTRILLK
ncbi:aquaporin-8-like [Pholidichthys leucotaenia]